MILFRKYSNIKDFLHRFTLLKIGKLHIRIHKIKNSDQTTLFHNHPFHYISVILKGGYKETVMHNGIYQKRINKFLSVICRSNKVFHRIDEIFGETITLFIAYGDYKWRAFNINATDDNGVYQREVKEKTLWAKKEDGVWFIGHSNKVDAMGETRHSIHQI